MAGFYHPAIFFLNLNLAQGPIFISQAIVTGKFIFFQTGGIIMSIKCDWPCWEIMNCDKSQKCLAKTRLDTPCWDIAREKSDYRFILEICVDCIVHILKGENAVLKKKEIQSIMTNKANCILTSDECLAIS